MGRQLIDGKGESGGRYLMVRALASSLARRGRSRFRHACAWLGMLLALGFAPQVFAQSSNECRMADPNSKGEHVEEICWLQLDGVALSSNGSTPMAFALPDGSTLRLTAVVAGLSGSPAGLQAVEAPSWEGSQFSGTSGWYTIYTPNFAVLQGNGNNSTRVVLQDIRLFNPLGQEVATPFELILADGESSNQGETLDFGVVSGGSRLEVVEWLGDNPANNPGLAPAPSGGCGGITALVDCLRVTGKSGTANAVVLATTRFGNPFSVVGQVGAVGGNQGFAFGVRWGGVKVRKELPAGRLYPQDQFTYSTRNVTDAIMDSDTTSGSMATSRYVAGHAVMPGNTITLLETMSPGSRSTLQQYDKSIRCSNDNIGSTTALPNGPYDPENPPGVDLRNKGDNVTCAIRNIPRRVDLVMEKSAPATVAAGQAFDYTLAISNLGTHDATGAVFTDALPAGITGISPASVTCTVVSGDADCGSLNVTVTGDDASGYSINGSIALLPGTDTAGSGGSQVQLTLGAVAPMASGSMTNTASVVLATSDTTVGEPDTENNADTAATQVVFAPAVTSAKELAIINGNAPAAGETVGLGDVLGYLITVTNSGNVALPEVVVRDDRIDPSSISCSDLAPGDSCVLSGTYTVVAADIVAGQVFNTAVVTTPGQDAVCPAGSTASACAPQVNVPTDSPAPGLDMVKSGAAPTGNTVGSTIAYSFAVTNTGNVTISDIIINDDLLTTPAACPVTTLAPGASTTCTGSYTLTQADINAGQVVNSATATGTAPPPPGGGTPPTVDTPPSTTTTLIDAAPSMTVVKSAAAPTGNTVGSTIAYSFAVINTGNVTISDIVINDALLTTPAVCPVTTLAAGASMTCTGSYTLTQADINAGQVVNSATATGTAPPPPGGGTPPPVDTPPSTTTTTIAAAPSMTVVKSAAAPSGNTVGSTIGYEFLVTNTGNVTISDVVINDDLLTAAPVCPVITLAPGASTTCTGGYTLTQADINAGQVVNTATATGTAPPPPGGGTPPPVDTPPSTTTTTIAAEPSVASAKLMSGNADEDGSGTVSVGDTLTYTITATNTGNITLADVVVSDALITPATVTCAVLEPGQSCVLTGTYAVTAADANSGVVVNTAVISDGAACPAGSTAAECNPSIEVPVVLAEVDAIDDSTTTPQNTPVSVPVTGNDLLNGAPAGTGAVVVEITGQPVNGSVTVNPDGTVTYIPAPGYSGTDTFEYRICEAANPANCDVATVTVTILPNVVEAVDDEHTAEAGVPLVIEVHGNDSSTGAPLDPTSISLVSGPESGTVTIGDNGTLTYLADFGFAGMDTFVYRICDTSVPTPMCDEATVRVTVTGETVLRLSKTTATRQVRIGDLVRYTLVVENVGVVDVANATVIDTPPAGFSYVEGSLQVADGDNSGGVSGQSPLRFEALDVAAGERATLVYMLRVGAGVRGGNHVNRARAYGIDGVTPLSNPATAEVMLEADPLLDESLVIGTVFHDRDGDGWQDSARLTGVQVQGGFAAAAYIAGSTTIDRGNGAVRVPDASAPMLHGIAVGALDGRDSPAQPAARVVISQRLRELSFTGDFVLTTAQGAIVRMDADGHARSERDGDAARGLTAAAPQVERRVARSGDGYVVDYVINNAGIHERGIPGVRIASVEGVLVETDQYGRYHLAGVDGGDWARGRNFILKLDPATLPSGAALTTDNPLVRRVTPGLPVRFDFGVQLPEIEIPGASTAEMQVEEVLFEPASAQLRSRYLPAVDAMAARLVEFGGGEVVITASGDEALAFERASVVQSALLERLPADVAAATTISVHRDAGHGGGEVAGLRDGELLLGTVLFDTDRAEIRAEFRPLIERIAAALEARGGGTVVLTGHTDLRAAAAYNTALGMRRATAVYEAIAAHLGPDLRGRVRVESGNPAAAPAASKD